MITNTVIFWQGNPEPLWEAFEVPASNGKNVEMESIFSQLILDMIGKAVFNCDFDSLSHDTGIVEVNVSVLYSFLFLFPRFGLS